MLRSARAPLALLAVLGLALAATFFLPSAAHIDVTHLAAWMFGAQG